MPINIWCDKKFWMLFSMGEWERIEVMRTQDENAYQFLTLYTIIWCMEIGNCYIEKLETLISNAEILHIHIHIQIGCKSSGKYKDRI